MINVVIFDKTLKWRTKRNLCMTYTSSFHHGTEVVRGHNIRDEKHVSKEPHIDPNGLHETWIDEPIEQAYDRIFGEAVKEYNAKQKRADRKIKSYLQNVRQNSKLNDRYEFITQVGNEKNHPSAELSKVILKEYLEDFKKRNVSLEVIGAYFHADEIGQTPHIHVDYIPVGKGNKTGLKIRNNLNSALKELGYETEFVEVEKSGNSYKKMLSAEMKFQNAEREALNEICQKHELKIENPNLSPENYCSSKQLREARNVRLSNEKEREELEVQKKEITDKKQRLEEQEKSLSDAQNGLLTRQKEQDEQETRLNIQASEIERKGQILSEYIKNAKENSLGVLDYIEKAEKDKFYLITFSEQKTLFKKIKETLTGAWSLVKKFSDKLEKVTTRLNNWRQNTTAENFIEIGQKMKLHGFKNYEELENYEQQQKKQSKNRYQGFSISD